MAEKKRQPAKTGISLDLGIGGMFKNIGDLIEQISDLAEKAEASGG